MMVYITKLLYLIIISTLFYCDSGGVFRSPTVNSLVISSNSDSIEVDARLQIDFTIDVTTNGLTSIDWLSTDSSIAVVSTNGLVTGNSVGIVTITAVSVLDGTHKDSMTIYVIPFGAGLTINGQLDTIKVAGNVDFLNAVVIPASLIDLVVWSSVPPGQVSSSGVVSFVEIGNLIVKARAGYYEDTVMYTVIEAVPTTGISIVGQSGTNRIVDEMEEILIGTVVPNTSTDSVVWSSIPPGRVSSLGVVSLIEPGEFAVIARSGNYNDTVTYIITSPATELSISGQLQTSKVVGELNDTLTALLVPMTSTDIVVWSSIPLGQVSSSGVVAFTKIGELVIIAKAGDYADTVMYEVIEAVPTTKVSISGQSSTKKILNESLGETLTVLLEPTTSTDKVVWNSIPSGQVSSLGVVSFTVPGELFVIAKAGDYTDTVRYLIISLTTGLSISGQLITSKVVGELDDTLTALVIPITSTDIVVWNSIPSGQVSSLGVVSFAVSGELVIIAKAGDYTDTVRYEVIEAVPATGIIISGPSNTDKILSELSNDTLTALVMPLTSTDTVVWNSIPPERVTSSGVVSFTEVGELVIIATAGDYADTIDYLVISSLTGLSISEKLTTRKVVGEEEVLTVLLTPATSTSTVMWRSIPLGRVSSLGTVFFTEVGKLIIIAQSGDYADTVIYQVIEAVPATGLSINGQLSNSKAINQEEILKALVIPTTSTDTVVWNSIPPERVTSSGVVLFTEVGELVIIATAGDYADTVNYLITSPATGLSINGQLSDSKAINQEEILTALVIPITSTDIVVWNSIPPERVTSSGVVSFTEVGELVIIATAGDYADTVTYQVIEAVSARGIIIGGQSPNISKTLGSSEERLSVLVIPLSSTDIVEWNSVPPGQVSPLGVVSFTKTGTLFVIARAGDYVDRVTYKIISPATGVNISGQSNMTKVVDESLDDTLTVQLIPIFSTDTVAWKSIPLNKISSSGVVSFTEIEDIIIIARAGKYADTVIYQVIAAIPSTGISISSPLSTVKVVDETLDETLRVQVVPTASTDVVVWSSIPPEQVTSSGVVSFTNVGRLSVVARAGNYADTVTYEVILPATAVIISPPLSTVKVVDETLDETLRAQVIPTASTDVVVWSSNPVGQVTSSGVVSFTNVGRLSVVARAGNYADTVIYEVIEAIPATAVIISGELSTSKIVDETLDETLRVQVVPTASTDVVVWSSIPPEQVSSSGIVSFTDVGTLFVIARAGDYADTVTYQVIEAIPATAVTISGKLSISKVLDESDEVLSALVIPGISTDIVEWSSVPVGKVTSSGVVSFTDVGTLFVIAKAGKHADTVLYQVILPATEISIRGQLNEYKILDDTNEILMAGVIPLASTDVVMWSSFPPGIVTLSGEVSFTRAGEFKVIARAGNYADTVIYTITSSATGLTIYGKLSTIKIVGESKGEILRAVIVPVGSTDIVEWNSIPPGNVISGIVLFSELGELKVIARAGNYADTVIYNVVSPVTGLSIIGQVDASKDLGDLNDSLSVRVTPFLSIEVVIWSSVPVGKVTSSGVVSFSEIGELMIIAKLGFITDTVTYTVTSPATEISIDGQLSTNKVINQEEFLTTLVIPPTSTDEVVWSSVPVGKVTQSGLVSFSETGKLMVIARAGNVSDTAIYQVIIPATELIISGQLSGDKVLGSPDEPLVAEVKPVASTDRLTWSSYPSGKVTQSGVVSFSETGSLLIIVRVGGVQKTVHYNITSPATGLIISGQLSTEKVIGETDERLAVTVRPSTSTDEVVWSSVPVGKVTQSGLVSFSETGKLMVIARAGNVSDTAIYQVSNQIIPAIELIISGQLSGDKVLGSPDEPLAVAVKPATSTDVVLWSSNPPGKVTQSGVVSFSETGSLFIIARAGNVSETVRYNITSPATGLIIRGQLSTEKVIGSRNEHLVADVRPSTSTDILTWSSHPPGKVTQSGVVSFTEGGELRVIVRAGNVSETVMYQVSSPATELIINGQLSEDKVLGSPNEHLVADLIPLTSTDRAVWSSIPPGRVTQSGVVSFTEAGELRVIARAGNVSETVMYQVSSPATELIISGQINTHKVLTETESLAVAVRPSTSTDVVLWSSHPPGQVTQTGLVLCVEVGELRVIARAGNVSDTVIYQVGSPATGLTISGQLSEDKVLGSPNEHLAADVRPSTSTDRAVWSSYPPGQVTQSGVVSFTEAGELRVTARAGNVSETVMYQIAIPATELTISGQSRNTNKVLESPDEYLAVAVGPPTSTDVAVWSSIPPGRVTQSGVVSFTEVGELRVIARARAGNVSDTVIYQVSSPATGLTISGQLSEDKVLGSPNEHLVADLIPLTSTDIAVWSSHPLGQVTQSGVVSFTEGGELRVIARAGNVSDTVIYQVSSPATGLTISGQLSEDKVLGSPNEHLVADVRPSTSTDIAVWSSHPPGQVTQSGVVSFTEGGELRVIARTVNISDTVIYQVSSPATELTISGQSRNTNKVLESPDEPLVADVRPSTSTDIAVWSSIPPGRVTGSGVVSFTEVGELRVIARAGNISDTVIYQVSSPATGLTISGQLSEDKVLGSPNEHLVADVRPSTSTDRAVWSSYPPGQVTQSGVVSFIEGGELRVTARAGNVSETVMYQIAIPATRLHISGQSINTNKVLESPDEYLGVAMGPPTSTDKVVWSSIPPGRVTQSGVVSFTEGGELRVIARARVGNVSDTVIYQVIIRTIGLSLGGGESSNSITRALGSPDEHLVIEVSPSTSTEELVWSSHPPGRVTESGLVSFSSLGQFTIIVKSGDQTLSIQVNVIVPATGLIISGQSSGDKVLGSRSEYLVAEVSPSTSTERRVVWSSIPPGRVTESGLVSFSETGELRVIARAGVGNVSDTVIYQVIIRTIGLSLGGGESSNSITRALGSPDEHLVIEVSPSTSTEELVWSSHPPGRVTESGLVSFSSSGQFTILVRSGYQVLPIQVNVIVPATGLVVSGKSRTNKVLGSSNEHLVADVSPSTSTDIAVWSSIPPGKVTQSGLVSFSKAGALRVIARAGNVSDTVRYRVTIPATGMVIRGQENTYKVLGSPNEHLRVTITPSRSTDRAVWSSRPSGKVTQSGVVSFSKVGILSITARAGNVSKTVRYRVALPATGLTISGQSRNTNKVLESPDESLRVTITPSRSTDVVVWSSNPPGRVTRSGVVSFTEVGRLSVTARAGNVSKTVRYNITSPATRVIVSGQLSEDKILGSPNEHLVADVRPSTSTDRAVWSSIPPGRVTESGVVSFTEVGELRVIARAGNVSDTVMYQVSVAGVKLDRLSLIAFTGDSSTTVQATLLLPLDHTGSLVWTSSLESVATVSDGVITIVGRGDATITATVGIYSATVNVTVHLGIYGYRIIKTDDSRFLSVAEVDFSDGDNRLDLTGTTSPTAVSSGSLENLEKANDFSYEQETFAKIGSLKQPGYLQILSTTRISFSSGIATVTWMLGESDPQVNNGATIVLLGAGGSPVGTISNGIVVTESGKDFFRMKFNAFTGEVLQQPVGQNRASN